MQMNNTIDYFTDLEIKLIKDMQNLLMRYNRNASKSLYNSLNNGLIDLEYNGNDKLIYKIEFPNNLDGSKTHAGFVMTQKRNIKKGGPSRAAIDALKLWITQKGISIGEGKLRTPMGKGPKKTEVVVVNGRKEAYINYGKKMANVEASSNDKDKQRTSFAFAIWYKIKKNKKIKTPVTNLLQPYENIRKSGSFRKGLATALKADGIDIIRLNRMNTKIGTKDSSVTTSSVIKIKM